MSRRSNLNNSDSPAQGIKFFDNHSGQGANYAENWYSANTILKKRWHKVMAALFALGMLIGTIDNLLITIAARADARARIVYHPTIGAMGAERYNELTFNLFLYIAFLTVAAIVCGIVILRKWRNHQANLRYRNLAQQRGLTLY